MQYTIDQLVGKFVELRDRSNELDRAHKLSLEKVASAMKSIQSELFKRAMEAGVSSFSSPAGTFFVSEKSSLKTSDWDATVEWIKANNRWDLLTKSITKTGFEEVLAEGVSIPGQELRRWKEGVVRRGKGSSSEGDE